MAERPIGELLDALKQLGVDARSENDNGCPPLAIHGGPISGGNVEIDCSISSQFLSALMLIAPYTQKGLEISATKGPVSKPYIDITIDVMRKCGVGVKRDHYQYFSVKGGQTYRAGHYTIEPDGSQASYFWAAAAITRGTVKLKNIRLDSTQGDVKFAEILRSMGCQLEQDNDGTTITGGALTGVEVDMANMPDVVPTLGVVAAFANGTTVIRNVTHLRVKESDRLAAVINELQKIGIRAYSKQDDLYIEGGRPHGAEIETYNDHRIAMSFAVAGLKVPEVKIKGEACVEKSFPNFWEVFDQLR
jgi:3-phosphoshikimate 1-carboxyvinyltransferase